MPCHAWEKEGMEISTFTPIQKKHVMSHSHYEINVSITKNTNSGSSTCLKNAPLNVIESYSK